MVGMVEPSLAIESIIAPPAADPGLFACAGALERVRHDLRRFLATPNPEDLEALRALLEAGRLAPVIDSLHPLHETAQALQHIEAGHARGKVVVTVRSSSEMPLREAPSASIEFSELR